MRSTRSFRFMALAALGLTVALLQFGGCLQSSTEPDSPSTSVAESSTLSLTQIRESVDMTDAQASKLGTAVGRWQKNTGDTPDLEFFAESAQVLEREQLRSLIRLVNEHQASRVRQGQGMQPRRQGGPGNGPGTCPEGPLGPGGFGRQGGSAECPQGMGPRRGMGNHGGRFGGPGPGIGLGDLELTEAQQEALRTARMEMHTAIQAAHEQFRDGSLTQEQLREAMEAARQAFETALAEILTPEQLAQLQQNRSERLVQMIERRIQRHEQRAERHLELLTQILGLSTEQVQAIEEIHAGVVPALQAILAGVQDGSLTLDAAHDALRTLQEETHAAIVDVLTPEQAELFAELRPHRRGRGFPGGCGA